jgi:excinuclease UvrABC nuclease subunit|tara:strand:+ start:1437 stop:2099 length:663 start_codon:yes stop_codon:yes gene_type:complete
MAHPSKIRELKKFDFDNEKPYIYFLINKGDVVYVGKTTNFLSRISSHTKNEYVTKEWREGELVKINRSLKKFTEIRYKEVDRVESLEEYEQKCIKKFLPKYNFCAFSKRQHEKQKNTKKQKTIQPIKLSEKIAKLIKCKICGTRMNELKPHVHQTKSMYKLKDGSYLCASHMCLRKHLNKKYDSFENEGKNYTPDEREDIRLLRACGWNDMLKKRYGLNR